ncbi:MAG: cation diffusion facilitator family transporter [Bacteroidia bacterium]
MSFHHHDHDHATVHTHNRTFALGILLNVIYTIVEVKFSISANSSSLLAEAGHHFADVLSIILAWVGTYFASHKHYRHLTYGFRKANIIFAVLNVGILFLTIFFLLHSSFEHLHEHEIVEGATVFWVSLVGVLINLLTIYLFYSNEKDDLNLQNAYYHSLLDAIVSVGVVIGGGLIWLTDWMPIDGIVAVIIAIVMLYNAFKLLKKAMRFALDAVPPTISYTKVYDFLAALPNVEGVHDLHIWGISTTEIALTAHLTVSCNLENFPNRQVNAELLAQFGISHITLQVEKAHCGEDCHEGK